MNNSVSKFSPLTEATFYILLALQKPNHGYGIIKDVETITKGRLKLAPGTLYGVIQKLLKNKLIKLLSVEESNKNKKEYVSTEKGNQLIQFEIKRLREMLTNSKEMGVS